MSQSKAEIHDVFIENLEALREWAEKTGAAVRNGTPSVWYYPPGWSGDPLNIEKLSEAFPRTKIADNYYAVVSDVKDAGVVGDLSVLQLQGDAIAALERSFRARHTSFIRARIHASARHSGHGEPSIGVIPQGLRGYVERLLKNVKEQKTSSNVKQSDKE